MKAIEIKLLVTFALWAYAKGLTDHSESAKSAYDSASDLAAANGLELIGLLNKAVRDTDFSRKKPAEIAEEFFDDEDSLSPKLKAKVMSWNTVARFFKPHIIPDIDGRCTVDLMNTMPIAVTRAQWEAMATAQGGLAL